MPIAFRVYKICTLAVLLGEADQSFALVTADVSYGRKALKVKQTSPLSTDLGSSSGTSITADFAYQPMMGIPLGVGLFYAIDKNTNLKQDNGTTSTFSETVGGLELAAVAPLPIIKPFLKFGYNLFGSSKLTVANSDTAASEKGYSEVDFKSGKVSGYRITGGVGYSIVPMVAVTLSYAYILESSVYSSSSIISSDGTAEIDLGSDQVKVTTNASTIALGVGISI